MISDIERLQKKYNLSRELAKKIEWIMFKYNLDEQRAIERYYRTKDYYKPKPKPVYKNIMIEENGIMKIVKRRIN